MKVALRNISVSLQPASPDVVVAELTRLRLVTISREPGAQDDLSLLVGAYLDELRNYPADVVVEVTRSWARSSRFWPSIAELTERMDRLVAPRRSLARALHRGYRPPETSPDWLPPTADEKAAVVEYLRRHGFSIETVRSENPLEKQPLTASERKRIGDELRYFRLLVEDDPRVQRRLREMDAV